VAKQQGLNNPVWNRHWGITWGCPKGGLVPKSGLAPWVAKLLRDSLDPPEAWMMQLEMAEVKGHQTQQQQLTLRIKFQFFHFLL
jgi:hypothetical protein